MRPDLSRVPVFYHNYINHVPEEDLHDAFRAGTEKFVQFLKTVPPGKQDYRYAEDKWTVKEVVQHIIDAERIFAYRALCFARKDSTFLPGFDENLYAANSKASQRNWEQLVQEFTAVRESSALLFSSFDEEQLESSGTSNNNSVYVRGIGFLLIGHSLHHLRVMLERYF